MSLEKKPLITHMFTADPSAHVFNGKIYIYPSHDIPHDGEDNDNGDEYQMADYHVFSLEPEGTVTDYGMVLHEDDVPWVSHQMWAPDIAYYNGKYLLYFPARDKDGNFRLGVASSDKPEGPFTPEPDCIPGSYSIDPACLVDDDGKLYVYNGGLWGGQMEKYKTGEFDPDGAEPAADEPEVGPLCGIMSEDGLSYAEGPFHLTILDENGEELRAGDEERRYFEGPWMHKYNGKYYYSYSTGTTHKIVYAIGDSPVGPFTYQGVILEPVLGWTTHHSIVEHEGKWYLFYHDCEISEGINHRRNVKYAELKYDENGKIITIKPYN